MTTTAPAARSLIRRTLAELRPGDRIYSVVALNDEIVPLATPWLVIEELHDVDPLPDSAEAVTVLGVNRTPMNLYPDTTRAVIAVREKGYTEPAAAATVATRQRGYVTSGGCYYRVIGTRASRDERWQYLGIRGADEAVARYRRDGWLVELRGRWFVTALPTIARQRDADS